MAPEFVAIILWPIWALSWWAAAFWSDPAQKRPTTGSEVLYRVVTGAGAILLFAFYGRFRQFRQWDAGIDFDWFMVATVALGFAFSWWARLYLGRLWSSNVTKKADHRVVDSGPYAIVRHPIYTGIITAAFATAILRGTLVALAGALIMSVGFWIKARLEERFLREQLGPEAYDSYRRRVPMLVPFGPKSA